MRSIMTVEKTLVWVVFASLVGRVRCYRRPFAIGDSDVSPPRLSALKENSELVTFVQNKNVKPLNNLKVQHGIVAGPQQEKGWKFYPADLNRGTNGDYIYVGYKRGYAHPITSIDFIAYDDNQATPVSEWEWSPIDLNRNAHGKFIYMYWKRGEPGKQAITNLLFLTMKDSYHPEIPGYTKVGPDLNQGAGGRFIWAYYSTVVAAPSVNDTKCSNNEIDVKEEAA